MTKCARLITRSVFFFFFLGFLSTLKPANRDLMPKHGGSRSPMCSLCLQTVVQEIFAEDHHAPPSGLNALAISLPLLSKVQCVNLLFLAFARYSCGSQE